LQTGHIAPACGFIGLGSQGAPIARRMIDAGLPTILWARRAGSLEAYRESPAKFARTIEDLGSQASHVGICVVTDDDVKEVCGRLVPAMSPGGRIAIHSTVHPDTCRVIARTAAERDIQVIDAPVSGGAPAAEAGTLTLMVGGDEATIRKAMPIFETFAKSIVRVGDVGAGQKAKLINNTLFVANLGLAHSALEAGQLLGIDREKLAELLQASSGRSFALDVRTRMDSPAAFRNGGQRLGEALRMLEEVLGADHNPARQLQHAADPFLDATASRTDRSAPASAKIADMNKNVK
jgi:3-hydroxyisobutyrate dehydrogenase